MLLYSEMVGIHVLWLLCYRVFGRWFEVIRKFANPDVYAVLVATKVCLINDPTSESVLIQVSRWMIQKSGKSVRTRLSRWQMSCNWR